MTDRIFADVIGDPISHSKSPMIHRFWLERLKLDATYYARRVEPGELASYIADASANPLWRGCNVTIPHKLAILDLVDDPGDVRGSIGAINTVARRADGTLFGTNTDAAGFYGPISDIDLAGKAAVVIGTGGAARAVLFALARVNIGNVALLARNPLAGAALLARFGIKGRVVPFGAPLPRADLLINASPLGMVGQPMLDLDLGTAGPDCLVYDLVYAPLVTPLLAQARELGLETIGGLEMLVGQARTAFELFYAVPPPIVSDDALFDLLTAAA